MVCTVAPGISIYADNVVCSVTGRDPNSVQTGSGRVTYVVWLWACDLYHGV